MMIKEFDEEERRTVMYAVRQFGQGGYPYPDEGNINSFTPEFALTCLHEALDRAKLTAAERELIEGIIYKLH
jgi:hypothetical protein